MGYYINPPDQTREEFLTEKGVKLSQAEFNSITDFDGQELPVCLVNNGDFTAAGIVYCNDELLAFGDPYDPRPKTYYLVPISDLDPYYKR